MIEAIDDLGQLPSGSHAVSFHSTDAEACDHAVAFLSGTPKGQAAMYWVPEATKKRQYDSVLSERSPGQVGCVAILSKEQIERTGGALRPVSEIRSFVGGHPEGVTAGGETISRYLNAGNADEHMEYEAWFQGQPRVGSRFLCPYDLRSVPPSSATQIIRELGANHTHVALSASTEPAVRLMQLFLFETLNDVPEPLRENLDWALRDGLVETRDDTRVIFLTEAGDRMVQAWSRSMTDNA